MLLTAAACGGGTSDSTVNVKTVATDLTYGVPDEEAPGLPPNTNPQPFDPLGSVAKSPVDEPITIPPRAPPGACPKAGLTDFPDAAPTEIRTKPKAGTYRWQVNGTQAVPTLGNVTLPAVDTRKILDVKDTSDGHSFVVEERELVFGSQYTVRTTYELRRTPGSVDQLVESVASGVDPAGLYLTKIERVHRTDSDSNSVFTPSPAVLVMPIPVELGFDLGSIGVDPISLEVLRSEGAVTKRARVDACGKVVETFFAKTIQEFVAADGTVSRRQYWYGIATGLGGIPVLEHIESPCVGDTGTPVGTGNCTADTVTFKLDAHIGQLEPA